jgi:hypothetical protein
MHRCFPLRWAIYLLCVLACASHGESIQLHEESYSYWVRYAGRFMDTKDVVSASVAAQLVIPGLEDITFSRRRCIFDVRVGGSSYIFNGDEAVSLSASSAMFLLKRYNSDTERVENVGSLTFRKNGSALNVVMQMKVRFYSLGALDNPSVPVSVRINKDDFDSTRTKTVFLTTTVQKTRSPFGKDFLNTRIVRDAVADFTRPRVRITAPRRTLKTTSETVQVQGTASDNRIVHSVWYQVGTNGWQMAAGATNWTATVEVPLGITTVFAQSIDAEGQLSPVARRKIFRQSPAE